MSLIQDLQDLLVQERGQVEAVRAFEDDIENMDPDIADGLHDVEESATWICQGLYHRITHLGDVPTLQTGDLPRRLLANVDTQDRLKVLCEEQSTLLHRVNEMLKGDHPDKPTREFLDETKRLHHQNMDWCRRILAQWKHESYLPG